MSLTAKFAFNMSATEVLPLNLDHSPDPTIVEDIGGPTGTLTATTAVPVTKQFTSNRQLSAGSDTIDLTNMPRSPVAVDFTGLKLQLFKIKAEAANTDDLLVKPAAVNGYNLFGTSADRLTLKPGQAVMVSGEEKLDDVGASAKDIDITSTDTDAKYDIQLVAG